MTLRLITGTIIDARDPFQYLPNLLERGILTRWEWDGERYIPSINKTLSHSSNGSFSIIQTTGSGKTILGAYYLFRAQAHGVNVASNIRIKWSKFNHDKDRESWIPGIRSIDEFKSLKGTRVLLDDIRALITSWNTSEAKVITELALASRKKGDYIDITTQRLENFVPPDMRYITDEIIVPFIQILDRTRKAPDGRAYPVKIIPLRFTPGYEFLGIEPTINLDSPGGQEVLNGFNTLEIAQKFSEEEVSMADQAGQENELKALDYLRSAAPQINWQHLNGKNVFDITSDKIAIDVVGVDADANLLTHHKNLLRHINTARKRGQKPYLMFEYKGSYGFIKITGTVMNSHSGNRIDTYRLHPFTLDKVLEILNNNE